MGLQIFENPISPSPIKILTSSFFCFKDPNEENVIHPKYFIISFIVTKIQRKVFSVIRIGGVTDPHISINIYYRFGILV